MYGESFLSMAHREWHYVNGANAVCPLDCGAGETYEYEDEESENFPIPVPSDPIPF